MQILITTIAVLCRIISNSLSNVFQKKLTQKQEKPVFVNFVNYFILSLLSIPLLFFVNILDFDIEFWLFSICGGIFGAICNCFMVLALEKGELSVLGR